MAQTVQFGPTAQISADGSVHVLISIIEDVGLRDPKIGPLLFDVCNEGIYADGTFKPFVVKSIFRMVVFQVFKEFVLVAIVESHHYGKDQEAFQ